MMERLHVGQGFGQRVGGTSFFFVWRDNQLGASFAEFGA